MGEGTWVKKQDFFKVNHQFFFKSTLDNSIHSLNQTIKKYFYNVEFDPGSG